MQRFLTLLTCRSQKREFLLEEIRHCVFGILYSPPLPELCLRSLSYVMEITNHPELVGGEGSKG